MSRWTCNLCGAQAKGIDVDLHRHYLKFHWRRDEL